MFSIISAFCGTLLSIIGRGHAFLFFKNTAEIKGIVIADKISDFCNTVVCCFQKHLGIGHTAFYKILHGCGMGILPEAANEPADAHTPGSSVFSMLISV